MLSRSSCLLALAVCFVAPTKLWAQGTSLAERLSALGEGAQEPQQSERPQQSEGRQAQRRTRGGKPAAVVQANNATSGGLASKLGLGKLLNGGIFDRESRPAVYDEPPAAYDDSERGAPRRGSASPPRSASSDSTAPRPRTGTSSSANRETTRRATSPGALSNSGRSSESAPTADPRTARLDKPKSSPIRTARRSPSTTPRSDELAEALRGIAGGSAETDSSVGVSDVPEADIADLPSYLQDAAPQQNVSRRSTSNRTAAQTPGTDESTFDLGAALRKAESQAGEGQAGEGRTSQSNREADAKGPTAAAPRAIARPTEASRSDARRGSAAPRVVSGPQGRARVAEVAEEVASAENAFEGAGVSLGAIPAEPTPSEELPQEQSSRPSRTNGAVAAAAGRPATPSHDENSAQSGATPEKVAVPAPVSVSQTKPKGTSDNNNRQLLSSLQQPLLASRVEGPRQIIVGREAQYFVTLSNSGQTAAEDVLVHVDVPAWAEVVDSDASLGMVETMRDERGTTTANYGGKQLGWRLDELAAGTSQTLDLTLVPREGRAMQLGVRWNHAPVGAAAVVEVQEPLLHIEVSGPSDVLYGDPQRYTLTLDNPGTGVADDVILELLPPGGVDDSLVSHRIGSIEPGDRKSIEIELTARQAGDLAMKATAIAAGGLRAETVKNVVCRKPELEMEWRGPDKKYSGSTATYYFRLRNPGTAPTSPLAVDVALPAGAEMVRASDGHVLAANKESLVWNLPGMRPGEEKFMELQCRLNRPGTNDFALVAKSSDGLLSVSKKITANVVALADLNLEIVDPTGPVPVGELAQYKVTIRNRGTTTARNIDVVGLFAEGIEPVSAQGAQSSIADGRVAFRTIEDLPAGRELVLRIEAKAIKEGTHTFRAEVVCEDLEIKLSADETTRFFVDEFSWDSPSSAYAK